MLEEVKNKRIKDISIYLILFLLFGISLYLFEVIIPFIVAFIIAYLVNPIKLFLDRFLNDTISSLLSIILLMLCLISILVLISPIIIQQTQNLITILPSYINKTEILINELNSQYLINEKIKSFGYLNFLKPFTEKLINSSNSVITDSIQFFNSLFDICLIFIISFYMSLEFKNIKVFFDNFEMRSNFKDFSILVKEIDTVLSKFIRGQVLVCFTLSVLYSTVLFLIGIEFGILLGLFAGIISFIPYIGALLGGGLTLMLGFFQFGFSIGLLLLLLVFLFGQLLFNAKISRKRNPTKSCLDFVCTINWSTFSWVYWCSYITSFSGNFWSGN